MGPTITKPYQTLKGIKSSPISTYSFNPRVKEVTGQVKKEVRNKMEPPLPSVAEPNTLALGLMSALENPTRSLANFPAINATGWVPPDPDLAVSPTHCVNVVNVSVGFFTRTGTKIFQQTLDGAGFFAGVATADFCFDPKAFYDPISKRFFIVCLEQDDAEEVSGLLLAVSDDSNPEGTWHRYRVDVVQEVDSEKFWLDYPGFGFSKDAVMITGNMFGFESGFNGIQFVVIPKAEMLTGAPLTVSKFSQGGGSVQVMRPNNDANASVLYGMNFASNSQARIHAVRDGGTGSPTLLSINAAIPTYNGPVQGGVSVNNHILDSLDGRIFNIHYRGGKLYATHGIRAAPGDPRNVARWYEINLRGWPEAANPPLYIQGGNVGQTGQHFILPAICANAIGEIALVMTRCSPSIVADFVIAARRPGDPAGTMRTPLKLAGSIGSQYGGSSNRWGDYFGLQTDPIDDRTFWGVGMIANAQGGWQTVINSFRLSVPFTDNADAISMYEGTSASGTVTSILNSDNAYYTVNSKAVLRTGEVASAIADFTLPGATLELSATVEAKAIKNVTGSLFFYNWNTSSWTYIGSTTLGTTDVTKTFGAGLQYTNFVNAQNKVRVMFRGIYPAKVGQTPLKYQLRIDQISLAGAS